MLAARVIPLSGGPGGVHCRNTLSNDTLSIFEDALGALGKGNGGAPIDYLEIGSAQGHSMALMGTLLQQRNRCGALVSIDPYFAGGYREGTGGPHRREYHLNVGKEMRDTALRVYGALGLEVEHIEATSQEALPRLLRDGRSFDLALIDGCHEGLVPLMDVGTALHMLRVGGIIILDDRDWDAVAPLDRLLEKELDRVASTTKMAAYRLPSGD